MKECGYMLFTNEVKDMDELVDACVNEAKNFIDLKSGDNIIVTGGLDQGKIGFTNLMKIETIK